MNRNIEATEQNFCFSDCDAAGDLMYVLVEDSDHSGMSVMRSGHGALVNTVLVRATRAEVHNFLLETIELDPDITPLVFRRAAHEKFGTERIGFFMPYFYFQCLRTEFQQEASR